MSSTGLLPRGFLDNITASITNRDVSSDMRKTKEEVDISVSEADMSIYFECITEDTNKWGEERYAVELNLAFRVEDSDEWSLIADGQERQLETEIQSAIESSNIYSGPVVVRLGAETTEKRWARKILCHKSSE